MEIYIVLNELFDEMSIHHKQFIIFSDTLIGLKIVQNPIYKILTAQGLNANICIPVFVNTIIFLIVSLLLLRCGDNEMLSPGPLKSNISLWSLMFKIYIQI